MVHKPFLKSYVLFLIVLATRELHSLELGHGSGPAYYQARIILTRTLQQLRPLSSPGIGSVLPGSVKFDEVDKQGRVGGFLDT